MRKRNHRVLDDMKLSPINVSEFYHPRSVFRYYVNVFITSTGIYWLNPHVELPFRNKLFLAACLGGDCASPSQITHIDFEM